MILPRHAALLSRLRLFLPSPINLPSYSVPLMCPRQTVVLDEDSLTCDIQCQYNDQCPGEKICCYSGCSSSCQYGVPPPNSCTVVRRLLEDDRDEPTSDEDEPPLGEFLPGCHREGFFNPVQVSEANRWCVNVVTGEPIGSAYTASDGLTLTCPNCTHNGRVFYVGQSFNDECNDCVCTETGVAVCTRRACLDPCVLPASPGTCEDRQNRYFFDRDSRFCQKFVYSGCGGNANRFSSVYNCLHACDSESVCLLDWDEGERCNDEEDSANPTRDLFYYYNAEEGACSSTVGYRCGGNGNRFHSGIDCLRTCDPSNPGPTDVHGNSCWEIACDTPFCGEGVQPVASDDFCCPVCPYEQECEDDEFRCLDGSCIRARLECDGLSDCDDGSDEIDDGCSPFIIACEFRCSDEQCVPEDYVCNGVLECDNGRDEVDCDVEVPQAPSYTLFECPESRDLLGDCDESECMVNTECREGKMCCLNNCNQRSCTEPHTSDIAGCRAIAQYLSTSNASYIPQCDSVGQFTPLQCTGEGENKLCWCVNIITGNPFTELSSDDDIDCRRCDYSRSRYYPGDVYTKTDDCNTCVCDSSGESICGRRACTEESCEVHEVTIDHGETKEFDCVICTCLYGLNCTRKDCSGIGVVRETVQVEMTFSGELPSSEEEQEEVERWAAYSVSILYSSFFSAQWCSKVNTGNVWRVYGP
ncbi:Kunitz-type U19-barytoxin-Tl1a [Geodia barretti]|uniref:Kunitz-type U19-barytoxin-Tl1a n=1 Tax=Geodia barretti TaxID=519541 RepID=A0AA35S0S1_GEOBA|nr:Kunitz-type U19-barytoxin-Tl1a [Geodia barretti]